MQFTTVLLKNFCVKIVRVAQQTKKENDFFCVSKLNIVFYFFEIETLKNVNNWKFYF